MPELTFVSNTGRCIGWHVSAVGPELTDERGRPCVVMGRGVRGRRDPDVLVYAAAFSAAGFEVLLFDFRGATFDASFGRWAARRRHRRDFQAAIDFARRLPDVDPERVVLWGSTPTAQHVLPAAAADERVVAALVLSRLSAAPSLASRDQPSTVRCPLLLQFVAADDLPAVDEQLAFLLSCSTPDDVAAVS